MTVFYSVYDEEKNLKKLCSLCINESQSAAKEIYIADKNIYMQRIAFNDKYIFLMLTKYITIDDVKMNVLRITDDGSETVKIAEYDTYATSSYFYGYLQLINDKLIVYDFNYNEIDKTNISSIMVMDFDGNMLDWDI